MRHLITPLDLSVEETMNILDLAERISIGPQLYKHVADGRQLATLFTNQVQERVYLLNLLC